MVVITITTHTHKKKVHFKIKINLQPLMVISLLSRFYVEPNNSEFLKQKEFSAQ